MLLLVFSQEKYYCTKIKLIPSFYQIIIIFVVVGALHLVVLVLSIKTLGVVFSMCVIFTNK